MSVSNRSRQSNYYGDRSRGWNFVRGAFALLALIGISFLFGFFVLARLMPDTRAASNGMPAAVTSTDSSAQTNSQPPTNNHQAAVPPTAQKHDTATSGPTLEPEADEPSVQKPTTLDGNDSNALPPTNEASKSERDDLNKITHNSTPPFVPAEEMRTNSGPVQSPSSLDNKRLSRRERERERRREQAENAAPAETAPTTASNSLFRVQVGVYSTKEAAEQEAAKVRERGFDANVQTSTDSGRMLYHIQNGVYRSRTNAEAMQKRLKDAGIDTHLAEIAKGTADKP